MLAFWNNIEIPNRIRTTLVNLMFGPLTVFMVLLFRPFGIRFSFYDMPFFLLMFKYGLIIGLVLWVDGILFDKKDAYFKKRLRSSLMYKVLRVLLIVISILLSCLVLFRFSPFFEHINLQGIWIILQLSVFILTPALLLRNWLLNKFPDRASYQKIHLSAADKGGGFSIDPEKLLFIKCEDNYAAVHYIAGDDLQKSVQKRLIRNTISNLHRSLAKNGIIKCHRSFLVNTKKIQAVKGPKKKMKLVLEHVTDEIPISRQYIAHFKLFRK